MAFVLFCFQLMLCVVKAQTADIQRDDSINFLDVKEIINGFASNRFKLAVALNISMQNASNIITQSS